MTQPNVHELLDIARSTLLEQLLPALPGELRYPALMIANAMAIAARESRLGTLAEDQERTRLAALVDEAPAALPDLRRQLARAIRQGSHDAPANPSHPDRDIAPGHARPLGDQQPQGLALNGVSHPHSPTDKNKEGQP